VGNKPGSAPSAFNPTPRPARIITDVYFTPYVPHQELNLDANATLDFVVVRSDGERIAVNLDIVAPEKSARAAGFAAEVNWGSARC
jgi:hypothetical protein